MTNGPHIAAQELAFDPEESLEGGCVAPAQSFDTFFIEHRRALSAFLRRRAATEDDVQEIVQESYLRILRYGYDDSRPAVVWKSLLYRIATNLALSRVRSDLSRNVAGQQSVDDLELVSEAPSQERTVLAQQELELIRQVIAGLPPKCRKVFLLSRAHGKTYPEIAQICGISVKMVEKYISQVLAALRVAVGECA
ncbi:RNA polymerase sigma factor [Pseudoxanthomonas winnipegensis]|uniref:RNA polymerase sigma factor n=1 Tax=Pseudoxanthomonas winnipegensis TaxID=2480810 RepID=UPI002578DB04|nr:RNA polymerase sigma factor [Pseudoxanthomonas winnipegensis]WJI16107.1 RNA polymerase sigma factor [Pseudoxanthomonas winnipegensis]